MRSWLVRVQGKISKALYWVSRAAGSQKDRPLLRGLHVKSINDRLILYGSNGFLLHMLSLDPLLAEEMHRPIYHGERMWLPPMDGSWIPSQSIRSSGPQLLEFLEETQPFPDPAVIISQTIQGAPVASISLNAGLLKKLLSGVGNKTRLDLWLYGSDKVMLVRVNEDDLFQQIALLMPMHAAKLEVPKL